MTQSDPLAQQFRSLVKREMYRTNMTQKALAKKLGIVESSVTHKLNSQASLGSLSRSKISAALGLRIELTLCH